MKKSRNNSLNTYHNSYAYVAMTKQPQVSYFGGDLHEDFAPCSYSKSLLALVAS